MVKRSRLRPLTAATGVRISLGSPKKTYPFISGYVFFAQEIDPCQEFANSAKRNVGYRLKE